MKKILWLPGLIIIAVIYFFPNEWGNKKNVIRGSRWWAYKDTLAPIISIFLYLLFGILAIYLSYYKVENQENLNSATLPISSNFESPSQTIESISNASIEDFQASQAPTNLNDNEPNSSVINLPIKTPSNSTLTNDSEAGKQSTALDINANEVLTKTIDEVKEAPSVKADEELNSIERRHYIPGH